ncbi:MAG: hypothetical protein EOO38_07275, partial [Cytophagaceae bacterium]
GTTGEQKAALSCAPSSAAIADATRRKNATSGSCALIACNARARPCAAPAAHHAAARHGDAQLRGYIMKRAYVRPPTLPRATTLLPRVCTSQPWAAVFGRSMYRRDGGMSAVQRAYTALQRSGSAVLAGREEVGRSMERFKSMAGIDMRACPPIIHIAGTKGKGSTAAICESILRQAGLRTGASWARRARRTRCAHPSRCQLQRLHSTERTLCTRTHTNLRKHDGHAGLF